MQWKPHTRRTAPSSSGGEGRYLQMATAGTKPWQGPTVPRGTRPEPSDTAERMVWLVTGDPQPPAALFRAMQKAIRKN